MWQKPLSCCGNRAWNPIWDAKLRGSRQVEKCGEASFFPLPIGRWWQWNVTNVSWTIAMGIRLRLGARLVIIVGILDLSRCQGHTHHTQTNGNQSLLTVSSNSVFSPRNRHSKSWPIASHILVSSTCGSMLRVPHRTRCFKKAHNSAPCWARGADWKAGPAAWKRTSHEFVVKGYWLCIGFFCKPLCGPNCCNFLYLFDTCWFLQLLPPTQVAKGFIFRGIFRSQSHTISKAQWSETCLEVSQQAMEYKNSEILQATGNHTVSFVRMQPCCPHAHGSTSCPYCARSNLKNLIIFDNIW